MANKFVRGVVTGQICTQANTDVTNWESLVEVARLVDEDGTVTKPEDSEGMDPPTLQYHKGRTQTP